LNDAAADTSRSRRIVASVTGDAENLQAGLWHGKQARQLAVQGPRFADRDAARREWW